MKLDWDWQSRYSERISIATQELHNHIERLYSLRGKSLDDTVDGTDLIVSSIIWNTLSEINECLETVNKNEQALGVCAYREWRTK